MKSKYIFFALVLLFLFWIVGAFIVSANIQQPKTVNEYRIDGSEALPEEVPASFQQPEY